MSRSYLFQHFTIPAEVSALDVKAELLQSVSAPGQHIRTLKFNIPGTQDQQLQSTFVRIHHYLASVTTINLENVKFDWDGYFEPTQIALHSFQRLHTLDFGDYGSAHFPSWSVATRFLAGFPVLRKLRIRDFYVDTDFDAPDHPQDEAGAEFPPQLTELYLETYGQLFVEWILDSDPDIDLSLAVFSWRNPRSYRVLHSLLERCRNSLLCVQLALFAAGM